MGRGEMPLHGEPKNCPLGFVSSFSDEENLSDVIDIAVEDATTQCSNIGLFVIDCH